MLTRHGVKPEQLPPPLREGHRFETRPRAAASSTRHPRCASDTFALLQRGARAAARGGQAGADPDAVPAVFRGQRGQPGVHRLGAATGWRPTGWPWSSGTSPGWSRTTLESTLELLASAWARPTSAWTSPGCRRAERAATHRRRHLRHRLRALQRPQRRHLERPGPDRRRAFQATSTRRRSCTEWVEPVRRLQEQAQTTYVMFNNCFADYAPRNAQQMVSLLDVAGE